MAASVLLNPIQGRDEITHSALKTRYVHYLCEGCCWKLEEYTVFSNSTTTSTDCGAVLTPTRCWTRS